MGLIVKQATTSAAKEYVISTFLPYNTIVKVAYAAGKEVLKIRFDDLEFAPGETDLTDKQQNFLDSFSALMLDKKDLQVKLCGVATAADIGLPLTTEIKDKKQLAQLNEISEKRVDNFKEYMVEQAKVPSARLLVCSPQIDTSDDAKPVIQFVN